MAHDENEAHRAKVEAIAAEVRERVRRGEPIHIQKGGVHHFVPLPGDRRFAGRAVDISGLDQVLDIDVGAARCVVEPGVTFAALVAATLPHGLVPAVVPELEGITAGGAVAGCSVESMSFRHGGFHDTCAEYEVVTGDGRVLVCSPELEPELFHMIHGSYGTLAILTRITLRLVPAKRHVHLRYRRFDDAPSFDAALRSVVAEGQEDFVDGIIHGEGPGDFVLCLGRFVDAAPYTSSYRWLDIDYQSTRRRDEDYLTTPDYLFRYDTECHWLTRTLPPLEWKPVRLLLGKHVLGSENLIRWSKRLERLLALRRRPDVVVDVFIPARNLRTFLRWYAADFRFYPLWVVPYRVPVPYPWVAREHAARFRDVLLVDCAVYGKRNTEPGRDFSQLLEDKTYELDGIKTLISRNHHSRERFWQIYDEPAYRAAKARLDPEGVFADLYDKFHPER
ncbi:MAG: FAD-binding oxidoreductase [Myxococcales bacterium]|nr:FAD-binding oxidoreductase [Myxococcales bacterium]